MPIPAYATPTGRATFGATASDYTYRTVGGLVRVAPGTLTFYDAQVGGNKYTDLLLDGQPATEITVGPNGQIPTFQGPVGVVVLWAEDGDETTERISIVAMADVTEQAAEFARVAEDAADATAAVGNTNDAIIAGRVGDETSATNTALETFGDARYARLVAPLASSLTPPIVIGHRGAANIFPQSLQSSYVNAAGLAGIQAVEAGDYIRTTDGGLVDFHDAAVDALTTGSGNAADYSVAGLKRLVVDASSWFGGGWPDGQVSTLPENIGALRGIAVLVVEVKDLSDATASAMASKIKALGLEDSVILSSFTLSNLTVAEATGFTKMFLTGTVEMAHTHAQIAAAGVEYVSVDHLASGDLTGWVTSAKTAGLTPIAYTVNRQYDYDAAMAKGFDGVFSDDPLYAPRNYAAYRRTSTTWHRNGTWDHGMVVAGPGPFTAAQRGSFVGAPGAYRWKHTNNQVMLAGGICPVANPGGSYTIAAKFVVDQVPANNSQGANFFVCAADDRCQNLGGNVPSSYLFKLRGSGGIQAWAVNASGGATSLGTLATTAWSIPTLSAGVASGAAVTALPVNATTVALKVGHQFMLPTGQIVTLTAAAPVGSTSLTVASIAPSSAVVSGASLLPYITATIVVTPTQVTFTRTDEAAVGTISANDTSQRGGYIYPMNAIDTGTGSVSFHTIAVAA